MSYNFSESRKTKAELSRELEIGELLQIDQQYKKLVFEYESMVSSKSWRVTKPLRISMSNLKKIAYILLRNKKMF